MVDKLNIALLSHRFGNIGHTFMAVGVEEIVKDAFGPEVKTDHFEQHHFFDIYPFYHPLRLTHLIKHGSIPKIRNFLATEKACNFFWRQLKNLSIYNLAVACGGPSIIKGVWKVPEMKLMFLHQLGGFVYHGVPVLNLAVGSGGYGLERIPKTAKEAFEPEDIDYFKRLFSYTTCATVRDELAKKLWLQIGYDAPLIPCAAIAAGRRFEQYKDKMISTNEKHIIINFQKCGANEDWGQSVATEKWKKTIQELLMRISKRHKVVFLAHNETEYDLAGKVDSSIPRYLPKSFEKYARIIGRAKAGLVSRIHAAIPLAGIGVPVVGIGTDSRLGTLEVMGLKTYYIKNVSSELLEENLEYLMIKAQFEYERLIGLREDTIKQYSKIMQACAK